MELKPPLKTMFSSSYRFLLNILSNSFLPILLMGISTVVGAIVYRNIDAKIAKMSDQAVWGAKRQFAEMAKALKAEIGNGSGVEFAATPARESSKWMDVEKKCRNAVVQVRSSMFETNWAEPYRAPEAGEGVGSGVIIDAEGHALTNFHVIGNSLKIQLQVPCLGKERIGATTVGISPERDIALVKISPEGLAKIKAKLGEIPFLELGTSDSIKRGTEIMTMGYPLSKDSIKSTQGIISGWEKVRFGERDFGQCCLETTAPINPGSSGGPSISADGKIIGINFAGVVGAQNIGYIIPIDDIRHPIKDLYTPKLQRKIKIGCVPQPSTNVINKYLGNPEDGGFYVAKVLADSLAEKYGLIEGDVVYQINGYDIDRFGEVMVPWNEDRVHFTDVMNRYAEGDNIELVIYRSGTKKTITLTLEEPKQPPRIRIMFPGFEKVDYEIFGGVVFMELALNHLPLAEKNPRLVRYAEIDNRDKGVVIVTHVMPTSFAQEMRGVISPGLIVDAINGNKINSLADLRTQIKKSLDADYLRIRSDDQLYAIFEVPEVLKNEMRLAKMFLFDAEHSLSLKHAQEHSKTPTSGSSFFGFATGEEAPAE
jgi:serine protease Do